MSCRKEKNEWYSINGLYLVDKWPTKVYHIATQGGVDMKFISVRDLRGRSGQVWNQLARERDLVLTSNGKPMAILSAVSEGELEQSLAAIRRARAVAAVEKMQSRSLAAGMDKLSLNEINAEIRAARKTRRR